MSGGYFDYNQFRLDEIKEELEQVIKNNKSKDVDEYGDKIGYSLNYKTIREFKKAIKHLELAKLYTHRIDWLLSCDDGEDSFHERLKEELNEFKNKTRT